MDQLKNFKNGLIKDNPVFSLFLGICSTLAITTTINNAIGMGVSVIIVLTMSNVIISMIRKITPDEIRIREQRSSTMNNSILSFVFWKIQNLVAIMCTVKR